MHHRPLMRALAGIARALVVALLVLWSGLAAASDCTPALYKRVTAALKDPAFRDLAQDWVTRLHKADAVTARGMIKSAVHKDVKALKEGFRDLPSGANPFASEDEIYRTIGELTDDAYEGAPGLRETIGNLFADTSPNEKGALLTLKIAQERGLAAKVVAGNGAGFERTVTLNGASRKYDMLEPSPLGSNALGGIVHENKNWTTAISGADDFRLVHFADEFRRDILIHSTTDWNHYRINLRKVVEGQSDVIRDRLVQEFSRKEIVDTLGVGAATQLRARFEQLWNAGASGSLVSFR